MAGTGISVVIPSFNQCRYLEQAIVSVLEQDHPEKEVLIMDGGSTDGSAEVIRRYSDRLAYWQSQADGGQTNAIKLGFSRCRGKIIGWLNSDDVLAPGALRRVAEAAAGKRTAECVFFGGHRVIDSGGVVQEIYPGSPVVPWVAKTLKPAICQAGTFFGRQAYDAVGGLDASLGYGMDLDLWYRFLAAGIPFVYIGALQADFRRHPEQKGHSRKWLELNDRENRLICEKYGVPVGRSYRASAARLFHVAQGALSGATLRTLAFRIAKRHRWKAFSERYSS
jgi:glycosyltransferase involved in cell wall biosynthesis